MIGFVRKNNNPKNKKTADCVIRAVSTSTKTSYEDVRDGLFEIMKKTGYEMTTKNVYERYLKMLGWVKMKQPKKPDGTKFLVGEIDSLVNTNKRNVIISLANHLTAVEDGVLVDLRDCRYKTIGNYYIKK